jgi:histidyl-tRNA synthetase
MKSDAPKAQILRGMKDILPSEVERWQHVEACARQVFTTYGYLEIRTPILEDKLLFERSIGGATDIVQKEMYTLTDRGGRQMALRPEGTASIARAYIEHNLAKKIGFMKLFYLGPMFRGERPQAGRQRQFHQIGVEAIGSASPYVDVEVISLLIRFLESLNISGWKLRINNLGCFKDRTKINSSLKSILKQHRSRLCDDCKGRIERNPLRVLDCKAETCNQVARELPDILGGHICRECKEHFKEVKEGLAALHISFEVDAKMVRGLDYYTRTGFEVTHQSLGSKDAIGAGGRYDNLIKEFGGPDVGACGFAIGTERLLMALGATAVPVQKKKKPFVYMATLGAASYRKGIELVDALRRHGICSDIDYEQKSLKAQMRLADKRGAAFVLIIGEEELKSAQVVLRNMKTKEQQPISIANVPQELEARIHA